MECDWSRRCTYHFALAVSIYRLVSETRTAPNRVISYSTSLHVLYFKSTRHTPYPRDMVGGGAHCQQG